MSLFFLFYILVLSPGIKIYLLTEEESNCLENFSVTICLLTMYEDKSEMECMKANMRL